MASFTQIFLAPDTAVTALTTHVTQGDIIPNGVTAVLIKFGGAVPVNVTGSYVAIQWGNGSSWQTIRAIARDGEYRVDREFLGDGVNRFRLIRANGDVANRVMVAWIEGYLKDA